MQKKTFIASALFVSGLLVGPVTFAASYDIYVDDSNYTGTEDGTQENPYNTIGEAITAAELNDSDHRRIYVKKGTYAEEIELSDDIELYGQDKNQTIIDGDGSGTIVTMDDNTVLENLTIYKGKTGVKIKKNSEAEIKDVKIKKTKNIGINIEKSTKRETVTIEDCDIYKGKGKGIYMEKNNYAEIINNEIYDNEEEGIDIRSKAKGKIKSNEIYDNGEGGIELVVERSKIDISKNKINGNSASGISLQAYEGGLSNKSDSDIEKNKITSNKHYGIKCETPSGLDNDEPVLWSQSVNLDKNIIEKNREGLFSGNCHFVAY